jgi:hypothetical protein
MEVLRDIGLFVSDLIRAISDPPMMTVTTIAKRKGWLTEVAALALLGVWRLARGILDIIMGTVDVTKYFLMAPR